MFAENGNQVIKNGGFDVFRKIDILAEFVRFKNEALNLEYPLKRCNIFFKNFVIFIEAQGPQGLRSHGACPEN